MASFTIRIHNASGIPTDQQLTKPTNVVGRRRGSDLLIMDTSVSGRHGELRFDGRGVQFVDVGSSNGSFTKSERRLAKDETYMLHVGDRLQLGNIDIELLDLQVARAPAPAAPRAEVEEATSMLTADQIAAVLEAETSSNPPAAAPRAAAPRAPAPAAAPVRAASRSTREPARSAREPARSEAAPRRREPGSAPARAPEPAPVPVASHGDPMEAVEEEDDWAAQAAAGDDDDWAAEAAAGGGTSKKDAKKAKKKAAKKAAGPPGGAVKASRPKPTREGGVAPDELEELDDEEFVPALKGLLMGAINGAVDLVKGWKEQRPTGMDDVKEDFAAAWEVMEPTIKESPIPIAAVAGAGAVLGLLSMLIPSIAFLFTLVNIAVSLAGIVASAATYVYFLRRRIGQPISPVEAVQAIVGDVKPFAMTMLFSAAAIIPGVIAVILPGMMLAAFVMPAYYVEERRGFAAVRRSLWLYKQDGRRIFMSLLFLGLLGFVANFVVGILAGIHLIAAILLLPVAVAVQAFLGAFGAAFVLELYFDVRARYDATDGEQDVRENLGDG